jgi:DNA ligase-associated metallophosphoesterase
MNDINSIESLNTTIAGAGIILHPLKAIYYPLEKALIISDAHLGKADHFRKSGIAVPQKVNTTNLERLNQLIHEFEPCRVIFLGDLFHSSLNAAWNDFEYLINGYSDILFELVKGNHDILPQAVYDSSILKIYEDELILGPFLLTHIPREEKTSLYNLAGHIHPGVVMKGKAKQYLKLPCFFFSDWQGIVPAFGAFTGLYKMKTKGDDQVYVVSGEKVVRVR